ncbi:fibronectin type III domain-containing protein [Butyricimonas hominis]|uniref:Fibronectin type III domain-containing protein n=1 Tax=Butyricimonas hominis TaxID=2763032 RepID=A0ABR7CZF5_9BACT|nr:fibronectin type III domain-containing protein [Butyricimonas hominis]MBC5621058.1 fibronectin type III domain-containing protein [Butyricimonas hominis]
MKRNMLKTLLFASLGIIMAIVFTSAKVSISPPDPPGIPLVIEMHKDNCKIKYSAPLRDGGAPIIGYFVEKKYISEERWTLINLRPIIELEYTVDNLTEGKQVQFRVYAINAAGRGPVSEACDPITVREH